MLIVERFKRRFYDSHPKLPLDPDSDQLRAVRPMHMDWAYIALVAFGAFFGTLARYGIGLLLPAGPNDWPTGTFLINIIGAFILGTLLQSLLRSGDDKGSRRIIRLVVGTGFLGAFTTYSSLATSTALMLSHNVIMAVEFSVSSVILGIAACAFGIAVATRFYKRIEA